jgi:hypothetical protein
MELSCSGESLVVRGRLTRLEVSMLFLRRLTMAYDVVPARCHQVVAPVRCLAGALRVPVRHLTGLRVIAVRHGVSRPQYPIQISGECNLITLRRCGI